jgi:hypothetical protein
MIKICRTEKRECLFYSYYMRVEGGCVEDQKSTEEAQHIECRWSIEHKTQKKS